MSSVSESKRGPGRPKSNFGTCKHYMVYLRRICGMSCDGELCSQHTHLKKLRESKPCAQRPYVDKPMHFCFHITRKGTRCKGRTLRVFCAQHKLDHTEADIEAIKQSEQYKREFAQKMTLRKPCAEVGVQSD